VCPENDYPSGHLPEARSIPTKQLENHLHRLPKHQDSVAYCCGRFCMFAKELFITAQRLKTLLRSDEQHISLMLKDIPLRPLHFESICTTNLGFPKI
jgi:hypothetical protein